LGAEAMSKLKDNADLREALKSPKMLEKLHSLMQAGPEGVQRAIAADAELAALEDKLMSALGMPAPAGPGGGGGAAAEADSSRQTKKRGWSRRMTVEERLKLSLVCVDAVKRAVAAYHTAAKEAGSRPADGLEVQDSALQALCSEVGEHVGQLEELVQDEDVAALVCDQAGVDAMCALAMALPALPPPAVGGSASVSGAAQALLLEAVHVLKAVAANSRCMTKVLEHDKGRTLVKMLASVQGVEPAAPAVQAGLAGLMEIGIQHDAIRRTLLKKSWNYAAAGAAAPQRVSLLAAAASAAADKRNPSLMEAALGCVTNAAFEEAGKEQLLAYEQGRAQGSVLDMALTIADSNPSGSGHAGASAGVLRAKAMRLLLNVTAAGPIRKLVGAGRGLGFVVRILDEQVAGAGGAAYSAAAADSLQHGQDVMDTALGLMMNLGLEDAHAEELVARGALTPLAAVLAGCPWSSCAARAAAAAARLLRFPAAAAQGRERGMLKALLLLIVRNAPGGGGGGAQVAEDGGVLSAATSARALEAACELLDPAVRALAQGLRNDEGSVRVVGEDTAALAALVATVRCGREGTVGNAALALQMVGNNDDHLERLGQAGAVPALLDVVHHMRGPAQRNAALALARVVKRPENLALLKALHGLDILNCYLKLK